MTRSVTFPSGLHLAEFPEFPRAVGERLGRNAHLSFAKAAAPAQAVAFSSRSSLASLPAVYEAARVGLDLPERIYNLFPPLAASIFRVGAVMVQIVGVLFLAKIYGIILDSWQLATVTVTAVATSLTVPGHTLGGRNPRHGASVDGRARSSGGNRHSARARYHS